jgi:plasmid stability protein
MAPTTDLIACTHASQCYHAGMPRQLTIRGVPDEVVEHLERRARSQGRSMNATINMILAQAAGIDERRQRLERYATWTAADLAEATDAVAAQRTIDERLWR